MLHQLGRFSVVGVSNTLVSFLVYAALRWAHSPAPAAAALAFGAGALNGYWWNGRWTFASGERRRSPGRYAVVQAGGVAGSALVVSVGQAAGLTSIASFVLALGAVTFVSFVASRSWAFARVAAPGARIGR